MDPRKQYEGKLEDCPLTNYPDYDEANAWTRSGFWTRSRKFGEAVGAGVAASGLREVD